MLFSSLVALSVSLASLSLVSAAPSGSYDVVAEQLTRRDGVADIASSFVRRGDDPAAIAKKKAEKELKKQLKAADAAAASDAKHRSGANHRESGRSSKPKDLKKGQYRK
ncbi:hypothetical protein C8J56DRAFT_1168252 [Mycena floridula]|nr:hypothetical protein C8J56DRAFT_1168252 [Mycena floridula]